MSFCKILFGISIWFSFFHSTCKAQSTSDSSVFSNYTPIAYFSILSQNDLYQKGNGGDKYFSNGIHFEFAQASLSKWPTKYLLPTLSKKAYNEYAFSLSQEIHTPYNISRTSVAKNDRPYCGILYATFSNHSNNFNAGRKLKSKLLVGAIGPASGAEQTQNWVHQNISHSIPANGWTHQINNGLLLDYEVSLVQRLPLPSKYIEFTVSAEGHIGTIRNFIQGGTHLKIGLFNTSFLNRGGLYNAKSPQPKNDQKTRSLRNGKKRTYTYFTNRKFQVYGFGHLNLGYQFYDGTVQGSLLPFAPSPYVFNAGRVNHTHHLLRIGITASFRKFQVEYAIVRTPDIYKNEGVYGWGEIRLCYSF